MSRSALPSTLHIGSITVETQDLFLAREVAAMIQAMPVPDATDGVISIDGKKIKWWRIHSNLNTSTAAKR